MILSLVDAEGISLFFLSLTMGKNDSYFKQGHLSKQNWQQVNALLNGLILYFSCVCFNRCNVDSKVSRVAWLNRTTILFTGSEKWSLDPRVVLLNNTAVTEYSIKILDVNLHDEGPYVCSILTNRKPESTKVHLVVQGKLLFKANLLSGGFGDL